MGIEVGDFIELAPHLISYDGEVIQIKADTIYVKSTQSGSINYVPLSLVMKVIKQRPEGEDWI